MALRLRYLFSFFGPMAGAQMMLGAAEIVLREHGVLDAAVITQALDGHPELAGSGLEYQSPPVTVRPSTVTLEELSRFWSGFFQASYTLSTLYEASVVLLTSALPAGGPGLPVLTVELDLGFGLPAPELGDLPPVTFAAGASVAVAGTGVMAGQFLQVGDAWVPIEATAGGALSARLPANARAGATLAQLGRAPATVIESVTAGVPGGPSGPPAPSAPELAAVPVPGSAPRPLVIRPVLSGMSFDQATGQVAVTIDPPPAAGQRVALTLVNLTAAADGVPAVRVGPVVSRRRSSRGRCCSACPRGRRPPRGLTWGWSKWTASAPSRRSQAAASPSRR